LEYVMFGVSQGQTRCKQELANWQWQYNIRTDLWEMGWVDVD